MRETRRATKIARITKSRPNNEGSWIAAPVILPTAVAPTQQTNITTYAEHERAIR
jgi:hypothetical protein